jgi:hypothetical protein
MRFGIAPWRRGATPIAYSTESSAPCINNQAVKYVSFEEERKNFFFEKKKQKTFISCRGCPSAYTTKDKNFLVLFFKKEHSCFLLIARPLPAG